MAAPSLTSGLTFIRQLIQDQNSGFQGSTDAEITVIINEKYMSWYKLIERRVQYVTAVTLTGANPLNTSDAGFIYPEIEAVFMSAFLGAGIDTPLTRMKWNDLWSSIEHDIDENGTYSTGTPAMYSAQRLHGSAEKWSFLIWPVNQVLLKAYVRVYPTALSGSAVPELGDAEGYWLYRMAAAEVAQYIGRPELVEGILAPIPDAIRGKMGVERKRDDPKRRVETSVLG